MEEAAKFQQEIAGIALSMRVPPFWRDKPRLWFITFEAAVSDLKKSDVQKAQMVVAQLAKEDIEQICDLLENPSERPYNAIKERLISAYEESDGKQLQKLLSDMELGDQKPSQLLRRMRNLAHNKVPDNTLRLMWINLLPPHVRSVLVVSDAISKDTALDELAKMADKMLEQTSEVPAVASVDNSQTQGNMQCIVEEIRKLHLEIAELKKDNCRCTHTSSPSHYHRRNHRHDRSRTPSRSHSRNYRSRSTTPSPHCYYHRKFGAKARHCTSPCSYNKDNNTEN